MQVSNSITDDIPLFLMTPETVLDEILGAFATFKVVEDVQSLNSLTEFTVTALSASPTFCASSSPPHVFSESINSLYNHFLHNFHRNAALTSLAACAKSATKAVWDLSTTPHPPPPSPHFTRGIVVARGRNEDLSWVQGIHMHHSNKCTEKMTCGEEDKESYEVPMKLPRLEDLENVEEVKVYEKTFTSPSSPTSLPFNLGGEAVIYLYHIINNYSTLPDVTVFLQGEPIAGAGGGTVHFNSLEELHSAILKTTPGKRFHPISNLILQNDWDTGLPYTEIDMRSGQREIYEMVGFPFQDPLPYPPSNKLWWHACGMFTASKEAIMSRPLHFYKDLYVMLTDAYPVNSGYPRGEHNEGGDTDGMCEGGKSEYGLYCTQFNTHTLFYVLERMWQYVFDFQNEVWHLDICGDRRLKEHLSNGGREEWLEMFCGKSEVREGGWLVSELEKYAESTSEPQHALELSLLQPRPASLVTTSTLDIIPILSVPSASDVDNGFDGMDEAVMCVEIGSHKSCNAWTGEGATREANRRTAAYC